MQLKRCENTWAWSRKQWNEVFQHVRVFSAPSTSAISQKAGFNVEPSFRVATAGGPAAVPSWRTIQRPCNNVPPNIFHPLIKYPNKTNKMSLLKSFHKQVEVKQSRDKRWPLRQKIRSKVELPGCPHLKKPVRSCVKLGCRLNKSIKIMCVSCHVYVIISFQISENQLSTWLQICLARQGSCRDKSSGSSYCTHASKDLFE